MPLDWSIISLDYERQIEDNGDNDDRPILFHLSSNRLDFWQKPSVTLEPVNRCVIVCT